MKILIACGGCLVTLIILLVLVGLVIPKSHTASRSARFRATPDQLYDLISGTQTWRPDVAHFEEFSDGGGRELQRECAHDGTMMVYEVSDRVRPFSLTRRIASEGLPYSGAWTYSLEAHGVYTSVRITETGQVTNPVFRFVSRFIIGYTRTMDTYLRALGDATGQRELDITD